MGLLATIAGPLADLVADVPLATLILTSLAVFITLSVVLNVLSQILFKDPKQPPLVFHWFPLIGSTITYGIDPIKFFDQCREKYGDIFTFVLLGRKMTVMLGTKGNEFILNGKLGDVNAEEVYGCLTTPVFGSDVVYDCPNSKLMEQKKFVKYGLTSDSLRSYVTLISDEVQDYFKCTSTFKGNKGSMEVVDNMAKLVIFSAARSLQGKEIRNKIDGTFADLYHDLDMGFSPINFMLPWAPLPHNRRRDIAHKKMVETYTEVIHSRRKAGNTHHDHDMIWNLMSCKYKNGTPIPDHEVAHMMIALLMAGQHSSSSTISWIVLHLADRPDICDELLKEQHDALGEDLPPLTFEDLARLPLHAQVVKETLRMHSPIHSIMRKVKNPLVVSGTPFTIPTSHTLLATPIMTGLSPHYFPNPGKWEPHRWDAGASGTNLPGEEEEESEKIDYGYGLVTKGTNSPYLPFGAGRHRCIGEQFAYVQLQTMIVQLVRLFKFSSLPGKKAVVKTDYTSLFSRPQPPAEILWEKRDKAGQ